MVYRRVASQIGRVLPKIKRVDLADFILAFQKRGSGLRLLKGFSDKPSVTIKKRWRGSTVYGVCYDMVLTTVSGGVPCL